MFPGEVILWDTVTGQAHHLFSQDDNAAYAATISPDGKRIAVATRRGVHLLEPGTGTDRLLAKSTSTDFAHIAFSPDGNTLAWAEEKGPVILLDASAGQQIATLAGRGPLAFSPDGRTLATASQDSDSMVLWAFRPGASATRCGGIRPNLLRCLFARRRYARDRKRRQVGEVMGPRVRKGVGHAG